MVKHNAKIYRWGMTFPKLDWENQEVLFNYRTELEITPVASVIHSKRGKDERKMIRRSEQIRNYK